MINVHPTAPGMLEEEHAFPRRGPALITSSRRAHHESSVVNAFARHTVPFVVANHVVGIDVLRPPEIHSRHIRRSRIAAIKGVKCRQPAQVHRLFDGGRRAVGVAAVKSAKSNLNMRTPRSYHICMVASRCGR